MLAAARHEDGSLDNGGDSRTLVVGLGDSGLATARYLAANGKRIVVIDSRAAPPGLAALRRELPEVPVILQSLDSRWLEGVDEVVLSPGLATDIPVALSARERGIPVSSDIELFARAARAPIVAVTGSNGKSTVTSLVAKLLEASGASVAAGGNLGPPALSLLGRAGVDLYVLEISSFQMETTESLRPRAAAVLNVSPDHLDRHGTLARYAQLKAKLLAAADMGVFNWDDPLVRQMGLAHPCAIPFSIKESLRRGMSTVQGPDGPWLARDREPLLSAAALLLRGEHNVANALAALALADAFGADRRSELDVLRTFSGLPHRCETVDIRNGVVFIDDSKGTNVAATVAALSGLPGPLWLIAGGLDKGADLAPLAEAGRGKLEGAILIGASADALADVLSTVCEVRNAASIDAAVEVAAEVARPGDTVLLSPACASQDMFVDYRARGEAFARAVRRLK
jgi:UDP-N-acetylmuramoylalanine--D-glutamate ligase